MNGHLRRCRCASGCFATQKPGSHVEAQFGTVRCLRRLATHLQESKHRKSPKGASGAFLNGLRLRGWSDGFLPATPEFAVCSFRSPSPALPLTPSSLLSRT